jgi:hypothetical protein
LAAALSPMMLASADFVSLGPVEGYRLKRRGHRRWSERCRVERLDAVIPGPTCDTEPPVRAPDASGFMAPSLISW